MCTFARDLINTDANKVAEISVCQAIIDNILDGFTDCIPMETKELTDDIPSHQFGLGGQYYTQMKRDRAFPLCPGYHSLSNAAVATFNSSGGIVQVDGDSPKRLMLPALFLQSIVSRSSLSTRGTFGLTSSIGNRLGQHFTVFLNNFLVAMCLESQGLSDYTFNQYESYPPSLSGLH
jgi:hypothetical protein